MRHEENGKQCAVASDATPYTGELEEAVCTLNNPNFAWMKEAG